MFATVCNFFLTWKGFFFPPNQLLKWHNVEILESQESNTNAGVSQSWLLLTLGCFLLASLTLLWSYFGYGSGERGGDAIWKLEWRQYSHHEVNHC